MGVSYDYDSIMHYEGKLFTTNGKTTISRANSSEAISRNLVMSTKDILEVRLMYQVKYAVVLLILYSNKADAWEG